MVGCGQLYLSLKSDHGVLWPSISMKESMDVLIVCMDIIKERRHLRLTLLVGCCLLCLSFDQIAWFFDQYSGKVKVASGTTFFGWVCSVAPYIQSNCRMLWPSISLERIKRYLSFCMKLLIKGRQYLRLPLLVKCGQLCLFSNEIAGSIHHQ